MNGNVSEIYSCFLVFFFYLSTKYYLMQSTNGHQEAGSSSTSGNNSECDSCDLAASASASSPEAAVFTMDMKSNEEKLLELTTRTGYQILQRNGQRIFGGPPPNWSGPPPPKGSEVFVGKVPRDCFEWDLVPIFEQVIK